MVQIVVSAIAVLFFIGNTNGYAYWQNESIFLKDHKDYCQIKCSGGAQHTLCGQKIKVGKECAKDWFNFDLGTEGYVEDVLMGLNGLRNRIAQKMRVANMVILTWDPELSLMASIFLARCHPFAKNPCTNLGSTNYETAEKEQPYLHVSECIGYRVSQFFPPNFFASILREWYYEKNNMQPPKIFTTDLNEHYGILKGHNNFTHLANPMCSRVGCAIGRYHDGYALLCYFFPYYHADVKFDRGPPGTTCPNLFPLRGEMFRNLCTNKAHQIQMDVIRIALLSLMVICCYTFMYLRVQDVPAPRARGFDLLAKVELVMPEPQ